MGLSESRGVRPTIHPTAMIAPGAEIIGDVTIGAGTCILTHAVIDAHDGAICIGENTLVMEHSLIRGRADHPTVIGDSIMVGPHTHINGATIKDEVFIATGASVFPGAKVGAGAELRINSVVQVNTVLAPGTVLPIGWVAVGDPAETMSPDRHDEIWNIQKELDFPGTVYRVSRTADMREILRTQLHIYRAGLGSSINKSSR